MFTSFKLPHFSANKMSPNSYKRGYQCSSNFVFRISKSRVQSKREFHITTSTNYDIAALMKMFNRFEKTKKELRDERDKERAKLEDHSKVNDDKIKERLLNIVAEWKDPLFLATTSQEEILHKRKVKGSLLDQYCYKHGVSPNDQNTRIRIAQLMSRTLKQDLRDMSNEEFISSKRNTLTRLVASESHHGIFPALMEKFTPCVNLCIQFTHPVYGEIIVYRGNTLTPTVTSSEPTIMFTGEADSFYTLLMVDIDYPSVFTPSGRSFLNWAVQNMPGTGERSEISSVVPFVPPIPPIGTGVHRVAFVLLKQTYGQTNLDFCKEINTLQDRKSFNMTEFMYSNHLLPVGLSFFQTRWDSEVSNTYSTMFPDTPEPQYVEQSYLPKLEKKFVSIHSGKFLFHPATPSEQ